MLPEEKVVEQVAEVPAEETLETTEEQTSTEETQTTSEQPELSPEAKELIEGSAPGEKEPAQEEEDLSVYLQTPETEEQKSNVQKRIDDLTAEIYSLKQENAQLKATKTTKVEGEETEYSEAQLRNALKKAIAEGDSDMVWDIQQYQFKQQEKRLVKMYQDEQTKLEQSVRAGQQEWESVLQTYSKYADSSQPEIYPGSHKDLDLKSKDSLLGKVAYMLYHSSDPSKVKIYRVPGGQRLAVADAFAAILRRKGTQKSSQTKLLEKRLAKEKSKSSIVGPGSPGKVDTGPAKPLTDTERLEEELAERKKFQEERS